MRKMFSKNNSLFVILFLFLIFIFQTIAYSALSSTMNITGDSYARVDINVRITNISIYSASENVISSFENFNKESTQVQVNLPDTDSTITYEVTITNKSTEDYILTNILEENYTNTNIGYKIEELEVLDTILKNSTQTFKITLYNKEGYSNQNTTLNLKYTFEVDEITPPTITGGSTSWVSTPLTISIEEPGTSLVGVKEYEYYISKSSTSPSNDVEATGTITSSITITEEGQRYIYYRTVANNNKKSTWSSYQISKLDTASPIIALDLANTINDTSDYTFPTSSDLGLSGGTVSCTETTTNTTVTKATDLKVGSRTIECTATKNNGLSQTVSKSVAVNGYYTASTPAYVISAMDDAYTSGTSIIIPNATSAIQYGPYKPYDAGVYLVTITGNNLNEVKQIDTYYNGKVSNIKVDYNINSISSSFLTYKINVPTDVADMEFVIRNTTGSAITIDNIKVEPSSNFEYNYKNSIYTIGGTTSNTSIILSSSSQYTYGPYKPLTAGTYKLVINGQNLDKISKVTVTEHQNSTSGTSSLVSATSTQAVYTITIPVDYTSSGAELYIYGTDGYQVTVDNYIIQRK